VSEREVVGSQKAAPIREGAGPGSAAPRTRPEVVLALQRAAGNRATTAAIHSGMLQRQVPPAAARSAPNVVDRVHMIDERGVAGWLNAALTFGEVSFTNASTMVDNALREIGSRRVRRLEIDAHSCLNGSEIELGLGNDCVATANLASFAPLLSRLSGKFTADGFVHLQECNVGENRPLITALARTFGVPVWAGTGGDAPGFRLNLGTYVRANPDGTYETRFWRP
jgi:hypothetical protein